MLSKSKCYVGYDDDEPLIFGPQAFPSFPELFVTKKNLHHNQHNIYSLTTSNIVEISNCKKKGKSRFCNNSFKHGQKLIL